MLLKALIVVLIGVLAVMLKACVVVLVTLVVVSFVTRFAGALNVDITLDVLMGSTMLVNVDVGVFLIARRALAIAFNPDVALLDTPGSSVALNKHLALDPFGSMLGWCVALDVDVDVGLFLWRLGLLGFFDRFQSGQVTEHLAETGVREVELLLSVLELLLLAKQPVDAVSDANAASGFNVTTDTLGVGCDVLERATDVSHGAIHPSWLLRVGLERIVDFADGE
jgi:hypothetical protein